MNNVDAIQAMDIANQWKWFKKEIKSYVTPREVVFEFSNGKVRRIPLPEEKMVVAVAPYIKRTHRGKIHDMSACQAELAEKEFYVRAIDQDGNVLIDETIATLRNGFLNCGCLGTVGSNGEFRDGIEKPKLRLKRSMTAKPV